MFQSRPLFMYDNPNRVKFNRKINAINFPLNNTISLSRHEQVCLIRLRFEGYLAHHRAMQIIMSRIFEGNMRTWKETIKLTDKKKLRNMTN